jgi:hypothetical protein
MEAPRDQNHVPAWLGVWCVDGTTLIPIKINPANGGMMIDTTSTISYTPTPLAQRDQNRVPGLLAAEGIDGLTYPVNVNADGAVLIAI